MRAGLAGAIAVVALLWLAPIGAAADEAYVLAMTWRPGFCAAHPGYEDCRDSAVAKERSLVLHGLWPPRDRTYCGVASSVVALDRQIEGERRGGWIGLPALDLPASMRERLAAVMPGARAGLDRHEWYKHGSCIASSPEAYYGAALRLAEAVRATRLAAALADSSGETVRIPTLLRAFEAEFGHGSGRALSLHCRDGRLEEIRLLIASDRIEAPLARDSIAIPAEPARGNCPSRLLVDIPAAAAGRAGA